MKKIKYILVIAGYIILCSATVYIDWHYRRLPYAVPYMLELWITYFSWFTEVITLMVLLLFGIIYIRENYGKYKLGTVIPCVIVVFTILLHTVIPLTETYINITFNLNMKKMEYVVELIEDKTIGKINVGKYWLPDKLRYVSHTGTVYNDTGADFMRPKDDESKLMFYVHCGAWKSSAVIYVAEGSELTDGDFGRNFDKVFKLKDNWYGAIMEWQ